MLSLESVSATIANVQVLRGITTQWQRGATVAIVGRNGAGKTTLLRARNSASATRPKTA